MIAAIDARKGTERYHARPEMSTMGYFNQPKLLIALGVLSATGCPTYAASRDAISADTVAALRAHRGQMVGVGPFAAATEPGRSEITCRGVGPIKTPDGGLFEEFIGKAFVSALTIAEVSAPTSPVTLTGRPESRLCLRPATSANSRPSAERRHKASRRPVSRLP